MSLFKLVSLPREFNQIQTVSMYDLLKQTGYFDKIDDVSEQDIYQELIVNQELVNDWLDYSQDKRCGGWYFLFRNNKYIVGRIYQGSNIETEYNDKFKACAIYIKNELVQIKQS